jgi:thiamine pyrophosphokinase
MVENIEITDIVTEHSEPYRGCMNNLNEMAKSRAPVNKLKSIMACSEGITQ